MLEMCSGVVNHGAVIICLHYIPRLARFFHVPLVYRNGLSRTLEVYRKVLSCTQLYIGRPLVNGCALDITTIDLSSHVPCVYRETPLGYLIYLRKSLWSSYLEPYTENSIQGDYYTRTLEVYREWNLLDNPGERPDFLNSSYDFKCACFNL